MLDSSENTAVAVFNIQVRPGAGAGIVRRLIASGAQVISYLPDNSYLVTGIRPAQLKSESVVAIREWNPGQAISTDLYSLAHAKERSNISMVPVVVAVAAPERLSRVTEALAAAGATVRWTSDDAAISQLGATVPPALLHDVLVALEQCTGLVWAELQPPLRMVNNRTVWRTQSGESGYTPIFDHGLHGEGQIIAIADSGIDADACFFQDPDHGLPAMNGRDGRAVSPSHRKIMAVDFYWEEEWPAPDRFDWDTHGHGTHTSGTAAGDANGDERHQNVDGMAPAARLIMQDGGFEADDCTDFPGFGCPVYPFGPMLQQAYDQGARVHSNSYGDEENFTPHNRYTERTADMDRFVWEHRDFVIVAAAGNAGPGDGSVISPSTGKNVISVAASWSGDLDPQCPATFSSRGWTHDDRIKPDVMANGSGIMSAGNDGDVESSNCFSAQMTGTSMATPAVAGLAALVRQYFIDGFYPSGVAVGDDGFVPSSALVRAMLIVSAIDISTTGCENVTPIPSREQGWGFVQLNRALAFADSDFGLWVDDSPRPFAATGDGHAQRVLELEQPGPLKIVLAWTDPPSTAAASVNLVNDLDLEVVGPTGTYRGNVLLDGASSPGGLPDRRNNVEVVWLPNAAAGIWVVNVEPYAINIPSQDFALVATGELAPRDAMRGVRGDRKQP